MKFEKHFENRLTIIISIGQKCLKIINYYLTMFTKVQPKSLGFHRILGSELGSLKRVYNSFSHTFCCGLLISGFWNVFSEKVKVHKITALWFISGPLDSKCWKPIALRFPKKVKLFVICSSNLVALWMYSFGRKKLRNSGLKSVALTNGLLRILSPIN